MAELKSSAERFAEEATKLQEFRKVNLGGIKDTVAEVLDLIGRVEGIFSTYTKHDISHIDSMLQMLDWLVPQQTMTVMTSVDWLLIVLSIYLHDLGMVVTSAEYERRMENEEFALFLERLKKDLEAKDYLARAENMSEPEKDRFFYQEYVRDKHAARIREWITGNHSRYWLQQFQTVSSEITSLMSNLPTRFRENLATVSESHHKNNLHKIDIYPLAQRYGSDPREIANVQYGAFILRTVDLIHVTKDRTPSVMYKSIRFSDLKSVDEWDKQQGIWSVNLKGRHFDPDDEQSHVIEVNADFSEERPFFALTEYLAWANQEIRQTKQWADVTRQLANAKGFVFPWRGIEGNIRVEGNLPRQMRFELDRGRLLDLLVGHTIYNEPTVAVRELLQNAIDAVRFQFHLDSKSPDQLKSNMGRVTVSWNPETRELTVEDNGMGMDLGTIENHLLRVGSSFYDTPQFQSENVDFTPISKFGIGILTCFMISDNIEIITCRASVGRRIRMTSVHADYLLKDLATGDQQLDGLEPNGTRIKLTLRPSVDLRTKTMLEIVRQWIIVPACDVHYHESGKDPQKIGFKNSAAALGYLMSNSGNAGSERFEIIDSQFSESSGASYDLAFVVRKLYFPEKPFVVSEVSREPISGVCIEGIRADWHLPGFESGMWAFLSVQGNRRFRTTVSRQNLETDDEYFHVAQLCAKELFKHVENEVRRITQLPGTPLSQASTAGRWVYDSLLNGATTSLSPYLGQLYAELPSVVLEYLSTGKEELGGRNLRSLNHVAELPEFWTIESRTVDYLGIISRDLGKELNIHSFLGNLAPEQYDPKVNPIVIDPEAFDNHLYNSHRIVEVDFSRKHQRTLLRWEQRSQPPKDLRPLFRNVTREQFVRLGAGLGLTRLIHQRSINDVLGGINLVSVARINGDVLGAIVVRTRLGTMLAEQSSIANDWKTIKDALESAVPQLSLSDRLTLCFGLMILDIFSSGKRITVVNPVRSDEIATMWRSTPSEINEILKKIERRVTINSEIDQSLGERTKWFRASEFWRNWDKPFEIDY